MSLCLSGLPSSPLPSLLAVQESHALASPRPRHPTLGTFPSLDPSPLKSISEDISLQGLSLPAPQPALSPRSTISTSQAARAPLRCKPPTLPPTTPPRGRLTPSDTTRPRAAHSGTPSRGPHGRRGSRGARRASLAFLTGSLAARRKGSQPGRTPLRGARGCDRRPPALERAPEAAPAPDRPAGALVGMAPQCHHGGATREFPIRQ